MAVAQLSASTPALVIDQTAPPDRAAHVHIERFDGPLALLLTLVEQRQLDVLEVPLGELAGAYLAQIAELGEARVAHLGSFVTVSAQLILIKSRALLPRPPEQPVPEAEGAADPEAELRARLIEYRQYRDAAGRLVDRLESGLTLFHRDAPVAVASGSVAPRPPTAEPPLDPLLLRDALIASLRLVPPPAPPPEVMRRTVTLEERAAVIRSALRRSPVLVLQDLLRDIEDRVVAAITFMAMLELVKTREVAIEQDAPFGPIVCRVPEAA